MLKPHTKIRVHLATKTGLISVALMAASVVLFHNVYGPVIFLRAVQAGELPVTDESLDRLGDAAARGMNLKDRYEVVNLLEDHQKHEQVEVVLQSIGEDSDHDTIDKDRIVLHLARNAVKAGWYEKAINRYRSYLKANPGDDDVRGEMAGVLLISGEKEEAIVEYQALADAHPDAARWLLLLADAALTTETTDTQPEMVHLEMAAEALRRAIGIEDTRLTRVRLAEVQGWMGQHEKALSGLLGITPIHVNESRVCRVLAQSVAQSEVLTAESVDAVVAIAAEALQGSGTNSGLYEDLARAMRRLKKDNDAVALFEKSLAIDPADRRLKLELANYLQDLKRYDEAELHYAELLSQVEHKPTEENKGASK